MEEMCRSGKKRRRPFKWDVIEREREEERRGWMQYGWYGWRVVMQGKMCDEFGEEQNMVRTLEEKEHR